MLYMNINIFNYIQLKIFFLSYNISKHNSPSVFAYPPPLLFPGSTPFCLPSEKSRIPRHNKHKKAKYNMAEKKSSNRAR